MSFLQKIDHGATSIYTDDNINPLPHQSTDPYAVPLYQDLPTYHGGSPLFCPTVSRTISTLTPNAGVVGPLQGVSIWELDTAFDANITIPTFLFSYHTMFMNATLTGNRTWTTPSAASLIQLLTHPNTGITNEPLLGTTMYHFIIGANGGTITIVAGAGCTLKGNAAPVINPYRRLHVRLTDLRPGTEAYELWCY